MMLTAIPACAQKHDWGDVFSDVMEKYGMVFTPNDKFTIRQKGEYHQIFDKADAPEGRKAEQPDVMLSMDSKDSKCRVCMYVWPFKLLMYEDGVKLDDDFNTAKMKMPSITTLGVLKTMLRTGGVPAKDIKHKWEVDNLKSIMTFLPSSYARKMFNTTYIAWTPMDLEDIVYDGKYTNARCVITGKHGDDIMLLFFMTDDGAENFDKYLDDVKGMFQFK